MANWIAIWPVTHSNLAKAERCCGRTEADEKGSDEEAIKNVFTIEVEMDSHGPLDPYALCEKCYEAERKKEGEKKTTCQDCKKVILRKDSFKWKQYDFYAAEGDEPTILCMPCKDSGEAHKKRVRENAEARDWEEYQSHYRQFGTAGDHEPR